MAKHTIKRLIFAGAALCATVCAAAQSVSLSWELVKNDVEPGIVESRLTITNHTGSNLTADGGWLIGYCWMSVHPYTFEGAELEETEVCASYHTLRPTATFRPLADGESRSYRFLQRGAIIRETCGPQGAFFIDSEGNASDAPIASAAFTGPDQWLRKSNPGYADGEWLYEYNTPKFALKMSKAEKAFRPLHLVPQPKEIIPSKKAANVNTWLVMNRNTELPAEGYRICFGKRAIQIEYADENGLFYAEQTLDRLRENGEKVYVSEIKDWPDLPHRGFMLDIARNYTPKEEVIKLLDWMARYKLNVLHFHIADDEAWRLEIPGLPELTEVGSRRGYTTDEHDRLYPAYNGGWDPTANTTANGFLTRQDYIDIVRFAHRRGIRITPEIDMPGHSRAAIVAMEERYRRYSNLSHARYHDKYMDLAEEYRLVDPDDQSVYSSAQYYTDDVICIARESCYRFAFKVIDEIAEMHKEAGAPLQAFHVGGDEVAHGAFERSPLCLEKMKELGLEHTYQLKDWFLRRLIDHLSPMGIQIAGWEEIAMRGNEANPVFAADNVLSWCWNSIPEWKGDEKPYTLANAGYPVVLACVGNNYIDMSYTNHHQERGLHWGGYTDERSTFDFLPFDIYRSVRYTMKREPRDIDAYDAQKTIRLQPEARKNIVGINGQLFAETIRSSEQVEQYVFPKLQGLAERAWNAVPVSLRQSAASTYQLGWIGGKGFPFEIERLVYLDQLYRYELPRLHREGVRFHLAQPGIHREDTDGKTLILMNTPVPGAVIRYTTDGSEPTEDSSIYTQPLDASSFGAAAIFRAKAFYLGEASNTTTL